MALFRAYPKPPVELVVGDLASGHIYTAINAIMQKGGNVMKKKFLSILLCAAMTVVMFTGCGKASDGGDGTPAAKEGTSAPVAASGDRIM